MFEYELKFCKIAKGDHCLGPLHHQDQDYCSSRKEILCLDRRFHLGFSLHLPTDVDHQARIRWMRSFHCPQEVLLNSFSIASFISYLSGCFPKYNDLILQFKSFDNCIHFTAVLHHARTCTSWKVSVTEYRTYHKKPQKLSFCCSIKEIIQYHLERITLYHDFSWLQIETKRDISFHRL